MADAYLSAFNGLSLLHRDAARRSPIYDSRMPQAHAETTTEFSLWVPAEPYDETVNQTWNNLAASVLGSSETEETSHDCPRSVCHRDASPSEQSRRSLTSKRVYDKSKKGIRYCQEWLPVIILLTAKAALEGEDLLELLAHEASRSVRRKKPGKTLVFRFTTSFCSNGRKQASKFRLIISKWKKRYTKTPARGQRRFKSTEDMAESNDHQKFILQELKTAISSWTQFEDFLQIPYEQVRSFTEEKAAKHYEETGVPLALADIKFDGNTESDVASENEFPPWSVSVVCKSFNNDDTAQSDGTASKIQPPPRSVLVCKNKKAVKFILSFLIRTYEKKLYREGETTPENPSALYSECLEELFHGFEKLLKYIQKNYVTRSGSF